jgi:hypothetical protein
MSPALVFINNYTQERSLINVRSVEKASVTAQLFVFIREFTWERNATSVMCVERSSARSPVCKLIRRSAL